MNAFNPLAAMKRLEAAGIDRVHAEAIASEVGDSRADLVTNDQLDAALNKQTIKLSVIMVAMLTLFCTVIGTIVSVFVSH